MSNQLPVDYVIGGACYTKASSFTRCALQPSDCTRDGNDFVAPFRLAVTAPLVSATCNRQESVRGLPPAVGGSGTSVRGRCALAGASIETLFQ